MVSFFFLWFENSCSELLDVLFIFFAIGKNKVGTCVFVGLATRGRERLIPKLTSMLEQKICENEKVYFFRAGQSAAHCCPVKYCKEKGRKYSAFRSVKINRALKRAVSVTTQQLFSQHPV